MTLKELLDIDILDLNKMTHKELRKAVGRLRDAGNKKLKRLEKAGLSVETPAQKQVYKSGGLFSTEGKNLNQLRSEFMRIKAFYEAPTSTATGYKKIRSEVISVLKNDYDITITDDQYDTFFRAYEDLKDRDSSVKEARFKYAVFRELQTMVEKDMTKDDILEQLTTERLSEIYEQQKRINRDMDSVSELYEAAKNS